MKSMAKGVLKQEPWLPACHKTLCQDSGTVPQVCLPGWKTCCFEVLSSTIKPPQESRVSKTRSKQNKTNVSITVFQLPDAAVRAKCLTAARRISRPLQVGGLPFFPVTMPAHAVRTFQSLAKGRPHSILFLDLREAFHRVLRPLLTGRLDQSSFLERVVAELALPPKAAAELAEAVRRPALQQAEATPWTRAFLEETLTDTWFCLNGQEDIVRTTIGSRPGDALADIVFFFLFSVIVNKVSCTLAASGINFTLPWSDAMQGSIVTSGIQPTGDLTLSDAIWADDLALLLLHPSAELAISEVAYACGVLVDTCLEHGMIPNMAPNKTEVICSVCGPGSRKVRLQHLNGQAPSIQINSQCRPDWRIRVVPRYKHLGGVLHHKGGCQQEARIRAGAAWQAFGKYRRKLFSRGDICVRDKTVVFGSVVSSVLLFGVGTWTQVSGKAVATLTEAYLAMGKIMLRKHLDFDANHIGRDHLLFLLQLPSIPSLIHAERLRYAASLCREGPDQLWALLHAEGGWLQLLQGSVSWLWGLMDGGSRHKVWQNAWQEWRGTLATSPGKWKALIARALHVSFWKDSAADQAQQYHGILSRCFIDAGAIPKPSDAYSGTEEACGVCRKTFAPFQAWSVHAFKVHGRVRPERLLTTGSACPKCLKTFACHTRLCNHLRHSVACREALIAAGFVADKQPGIGSTKANTGCDSLGVASIAQGPQPDWPVRPTALRPHVNQQLLDTLRGVFRDGVAPDMPLLLDEYRCILSSGCYSIKDMRTTLDAWTIDLEGDIGEELPLTILAAHRKATLWLREGLSPTWIVGGQPRQETASLCTFSQGVECLRTLDMRPIQKALVTPVGPCSFVTAPARLGGYLAARWPGSIECHVWKQDMQADQWTGCLFSFVKQHPQGLVALCFQDLTYPSLRLPATVKKLKQEHLQRQQVCDVVLVAAQLWVIGHPFLLTLPRSARQPCHALARCDQIIIGEVKGGWIISNTPRNPEQAWLADLFHLN